jgi:hypothetical protein
MVRVHGGDSDGSNFDLWACCASFLGNVIEKLLVTAIFNKKG